MANKRMFSKQITSSDAFVDMPASSQLLYFHLNMEADDDGFVGNPKRTIKMINVADDDLKILLAKRFILSFPSEIVVIKHWNLHNSVRKDMYKETQYFEEKKTLQIKDNSVYTELSNEHVTDSYHRIDKNRIDKNKLYSEETSQEIPEIIKAFTEINPACNRMYGNKTQRQACQDLINFYGFERVMSVVKNTLIKTNILEFFPSITTPVQLRDKWASLESAINKKQGEVTSKENKYKIV